MLLRIYNTPSVTYLNMYLSRYLGTLAVYQARAMVIHVQTHRFNILRRSQTTRHLRKSTHVEFVLYPPDTEAYPG